VGNGKQPSLSMMFRRRFGDEPTNSTNYVDERKGAIGTIGLKLNRR
jgi:hypothetical protein